MVNNKMAMLIKDNCIENIKMRHFQFILKSLYDKIMSLAYPNIVSVILIR